MAPFRPDSERPDARSALRELGQRREELRLLRTILSHIGELACWRPGADIRPQGMAEAKAATQAYELEVQNRCHDLEEWILGNWVPPPPPPLNPACEFLSRCLEQRSKAFFTRLLTNGFLGGRGEFTWKHESGFSLNLRFGGRRAVPAIWGFPTVNKKGMRARPADSLVFPFDFAIPAGMPESFANHICDDLRTND